uniref:Uncharacterized protein n=1 Tax=Geobacter metallireducens TaxID=28232 RepID=A0A831XLG6_GEOME
MADTGYVQNQLDYVVDDYIGLVGSPVAFLSGATGALYFSRSPRRPGRSIRFIQPRLETAGAERIVPDYLVNDSLVDLEWSNMSRFDLDRLLVWWRDTARGMAVAFTYVDLSGVHASVRFSTPKLPEYRERAHDSYEVKLQLRVQ